MVTEIGKSILSRREFARCLVLCTGGVILLEHGLADETPLVERKPVVSRFSGEHFLNQQMSASYRRDIEGETAVINSVDLNLTAKMIDPSKDLCVYAYDILVDERLVLPGRSVFLHASIVRFGKNGAFDLSGNSADGTDARALDGRELGQGGASGANGASGSSGGSLIVMCDELLGQLRFTSNGGDGAKGQDGGNGANGKPGTNGRNGKVNGQGQRGGDAGFGGAGGRGGDGGRLACFTFAELSEQPVALGVGGKGGDGGKNGKPGKGGAGGTGGYYTTPESADNGGGSGAATH